MIFRTFLILSYPVCTKVRSSLQLAHVNYELISKILFHILGKFGCLITEGVCKNYDLHVLRSTDRESIRQMKALWIHKGKPMWIGQSKRVSSRAPYIKLPGNRVLTPKVQRLPQFFLDIDVWDGKIWYSGGSLVNLGESILQQTLIFDFFFGFCCRPNLQIQLL